MEYLISNKSFNNAKSYGQLFFYGDFQFDNDKATLFEGHRIPIEKKVEPIEFEQLFNKEPKGIFNLIEYNSTKNKLRIKNDHLGQLLIYYYIDKELLIISNNFWRIFELIKKTPYKINKRFIKSKLFFLSTPLSDQTFIEGINILKSAQDFLIDTNLLTSKSQTYWDWVFPKQTNENFEEAAQIFDNDFNIFFDSLKKRFKNQPIGFGNSGGLDSRLIAYYGKEHGLNLKGLTIQDNIPGIFTTGTYHNSEKIAKYFGFKNTPILYSKGNFEEQMFLDIRNNPMGGNQLFKNPISLVPKIEAYITGQHGYMVGRDAWGSFLNNYTEKQLFEYYFYYISRHKFFPSKQRNLPKRIAKILFGINYNQFNIKNQSETPLSKIFNETENQEFSQFIFSFLEQNKHKSYLDKIRKFHHQTMGVHVMGGGFESLSRTVETYFTYYPNTFFNSMTWPSNFFEKKKMLKHLINTKSPFLASIPNQNFVPLHHQNITQKIISKASLLTRGNGLLYNFWINDSQYQKLFTKVFSRPNPIFSELFNPKQIKYLNLNHITPHGSLDFLKIKAILDIIYYNELEKLNKPDFLIR